MQPSVTSSDIKKAAALLKQGELVAFPTETVYGLGAMADSTSAIQKIFEMKGRSHKKPLSVLLPDKTHITHWAQNISYESKRLIDTFWPGPLTILLEARNHVFSKITAGTGKIGLRVSSHSVVEALISELGHALAVPSANISGQLSPTTAESVKEQLGSKVSLILKEDSCQIGIESTVIDMTTTPFIIRRLGAIGIDAIEFVVGEAVIVDTAHTPLNDPGCSIEWVEYPFHDIFLLPYAHKTALLAHSIPQSILSSEIAYIAMPCDPVLYQRCIYQTLFQLKQQSYQKILVERLPSKQKWISVTSCLNRWCKSAILNR